MVEVLNCVQFFSAAAQTAVAPFLFASVLLMFLWGLQIPLLFLLPSQQHCLPILLARSM